MGEICDMGFDGGELVVSIEEMYGISIPDKVAEKLRTVGECEQIIITKLREKGLDPDTEEINARCATQCAFYEMRNGLAKLLEIDPKSMRPGDRTEDYFPRKQRRQSFRKVRKELGWRVPVLVWPKYFYCLIVLAGGTMYFSNRIAGKTASLVACMVVLIVGVCAAIPLRRELPTECETLGGLSKRIFRWNFDKLYKPQEGPQKVFAMLRTLLALQTHQKEKDIQRETTINELNACYG